MRLKTIRNYKSKFVGFRCTIGEYNKIKRSAMLYAENNISEFALYAALNFRVSKGDLIDTPPNKKRRTKK